MLNEFKATDEWYKKAGESEGECEAGLREMNEWVGISTMRKGLFEMPIKYWMELPEAPNE
jgi:hypothetical protein